MFVSKLVRKFLPPCRRRVVVAAAAWSNEFKDGAAETDRSRHDFGCSVKIQNLEPPKNMFIHVA